MSIDHTHEEYKPVVNGRASICSWELHLTFRSDKQVKDFIRLLMEEEIIFDFECNKSLDGTSELYNLMIQGNWANNLCRIAKMADAVDYRMDL